MQHATLHSVHAKNNYKKQSTHYEFVYRDMQLMFPLKVACVKQYNEEEGVCVWYSGGIGGVFSPPHIFLPHSSLNHSIRATSGPLKRCL